MYKGDRCIILPAFRNTLLRSRHFLLTLRHLPYLDIASNPYNLHIKKAPAPYDENATPPGWWTRPQPITVYPQLLDCSPVLRLLGKIVVCMIKPSWFNPVPPRNRINVLSKPWIYNPADYNASPLLNGGTRCAKLFWNIEYTKVGVFVYLSSGVPWSEPLDDLAKEPGAPAQCEHQQYSQQHLGGNGKKLSRGKWYEVRYCQQHLAWGQFCKVIYNKHHIWENKIKSGKFSNVWGNLVKLGTVNNYE